jgi:putative hydrolase of the HAD superfamily
MGGTLDGDGLHWLDRFVELYAAAGATVARETIRGAFDAAERRAAEHGPIMSAHLDEMIDWHVGWQIDHLIATGVDGFPAGMADAPFRKKVVSAFVGAVREVAAANVRLLTTLRSTGFQLGVVSNGCGNVSVLCDDLGYTPFFSLVVDSRRVGLFKPDPAIYRHAAAVVGLPPSSILMVGDSFDRDIRPAHAIGMRTAWLEGAGGRPCPDRSIVDLPLRVLADLPRMLSALDARSRTVA